MDRRQFLAASAGALSLPAIGRAQATRPLRFVPQGNLASLDPVWSPFLPTRNHAYMIYDTLYGVDAAMEPRPQMAAGHVVEEDGRRWTITLREGLAFHDGEPVRARDAVASISRWMRRNSFGQKLHTVTDELSAPDDQRIVFHLKRPFPMLASALATPGQPAFIMPERVAQTDPFKQIQDTTGSGPFRYKRDEANPGSLFVYERNAAYRPVSSGTPSLTAGPKIAHFDRVEWQVIPEAATAGAALQRGEIDWFERPTPEQQTLLRGDPSVAIVEIETSGSGAFLRLNHLHPPFNDKALRRALLPAIVQSDFVMAIVGNDPAAFRTGTGVFTPGYAMANDAGLEALTGSRSLEQAKGLMKAAGYNGQSMRLIGGTDVLAPAALAQVAADLFPRLGLNVDVALTDWGTALQRRASREPVEKGGWSAVLSTFPGFDFADPSNHPLVRGNGIEGFPGWPTIPHLEQLRDAWFEAPDVATRWAICGDIQRTVLDEVAYVPLGFYVQQMALRRELTGMVQGMPIFWNIRRER